MKRFMIMVVLVVALLAGNVYAGESRAVDEYRQMTTNELRFHASQLIGFMALSEAKYARDLAAVNTFLHSLHELSAHNKPLPPGQTVKEVMSMIEYLRSDMESLEDNIHTLEDLLEDAMMVLNERRAS